MKTFKFHFVAAALALVIAPVFVLDAASGKSIETPATQPSSSDQPAVEKISLAEFEKLRSGKDAVVLDVRTPREFAEGHVPGAININWHARDFKQQVQKLDKSKTYLVHCQAGVRSAAATREMSTLDFPHLYDFSGGWSAYEKSGKPVAK